jgi:hypothetical protein
MKTKAYVRFLNRVAHFDADMELADVVNIAKDAGKLHSDQAQHMFDDVNPARHPRLAERANSDGGRTIAVGHLKTTLYSSFLKDIYEDLYAYMQEILAEAARNGLDPNRLVGEHRVSLTLSRSTSLDHGR